MFSTKQDHLRIYRCCLTFWISILLQQTGVEAVPNYVSLARCRVKCLEKFTSAPTKLQITHERCNSQECLNCWNSCHWLFDKLTPVVWKDVCQNTNMCPEPCQVACEFRIKMPAGTVTGDWELIVLAAQSDLEKTSIEWNLTSVSNPPLPSVQNHVVYVILARDRSNDGNGDWGSLTQTTAPYDEIKTDTLFPESEIWIRAVGINGTLASRKISIDTMYDQPKTMTLPPDLNLDVKTSTVNGRVQAVVTWQNLEVEDNVTISYTLTWFRKGCNVYPDGPYCELPDDVFYHTVTVMGKQKKTKRLPKLTFNTEFVIQLEGSHNGKRWIATKQIHTPFCYHVSSYFTRCAQEARPPGVPNTTVSPVDELWKLNVSDAVQNPNNTVSLNISWLPFLKQSGLLYNVTWRNKLSGTLGSLSFDSKTTTIPLVLQPDSSYEIKVVATYQEPDGQWQYLGEKLFDVSTYKPVTDSQAVQVSSKREPTNPSAEELGLIVGITCIITGVIILAVIFFLYKKRQSVKDVIITKTAVSKSNSYKSSMGYKADYANELLVVSDEWEVDPQQLKFSTPLGQGAFGKVVTGYCDEQKVAIKILKDSAPLSYKEDLLAEIGLMKKLGTHPNIVSLVGACTLHEPIALIMEYVPYGNLQSFLKKCRQEGEFRRKGRHRELTYSMVDSHGCIENGVITPTDILAFARQIVMAMEYLAEKKYVHRDLAARNVLLDYNKVVKVCDFGLSRDIYQDNQYKKLTSGKLPIKWMAIESLRDRVFTTQSDVWSFGILLWETVTMGASPYPNIALSDLFYMLSNGYRMEKPSNCSDELYSIMRHSWKDNPSERPTFSQLRYYIEDLLTRDCDYLELENIDVPLNNTDSSSLPLSDPFSTSAMAAEAEARAEGRLISVSSGDSMVVDVCVHDKSTDKLLCNDGDSDDISDYRNTKQKKSEVR